MLEDFGTTCMAISMGLTRGECASWVQAWGSIAAIAAAAWGVWWSARQQKKQVTVEEVRRLSTLATGLFFCTAMTRELLQSSKAGLPTFDPESRLRRQVEALEAVAPLDVPDWQAASALIHALHGYSLFKAQKFKTPEWPESRETYHRMREPWLNVALQEFENAEAIVRRQIVERGSKPPSLVYRLNDQVLHEQA